MEKRKLGRSGLQIAPLVFGGNVFGWTVPEAKAFELLDAFVAGGFQCVDTADVYSRWVPGNAGGESESILGKWMKARGNRSRVIVATKVGMEMGPEKKGLRAKYIVEAAEASLRRLQTDHIDLYQAHRDDESVPLAETLEAFSRLIQAGKVRAIGASNYAGSRLSEALRVSAEKSLPRYETLQPLYNLMDRADYERDLEPVCLKEGVGVIPYYALASGFLSGKYRSTADTVGHARGERAQRYLNERGMRVLAALDEIAAKHRAKPAQVAIAWLNARPSITAPIASATSLEQLHELMDAARLVLTKEDVAVLDRASAAE